MGVFRNELGGRVCVAGYYPFTELQFAYKIGQIKNVFNFLAGGTLTAWAGSYHRLALWAREKSVNIANPSLDPAEGVEIRWRTGAEEVCLTDMSGAQTGVRGVKMPDGSRSFRLPELRPYSICLLSGR